MKNRFISVSPVALALLLLFSFGAPIEAGPLAAQERDFDPRDLSGIWTNTGDIDSIGADVPPMTPAGEAKFNESVPSRSRSAEGERGVADPRLSNDPTFDCNPRGFPRILYDTTVAQFEFIHIEDRILQLLQRERTLRELWMDGRALPSGEDLDNIGPSWMGHSVAQWQGDELVVNTAGMDDRAWIDFFGQPKSFEARVEERYRRVDVDTIELQMTLYDPAFYTVPWVSETKILRRVPADEITFFGWAGLFSGVTDLMCAPMNNDRAPSTWRFSTPE